MATRGCFATLQISLTQQKAAIGQRPAHLHLMDIKVFAGDVFHWDLLNDLTETNHIQHSKK